MNMNVATSKGFTLVETLVAIAILLLVVIGPITVAQKGIKSAFYANEQVTAVFLAQEAIEAIRGLRDTNALRAYANDTDETWDWYGFLPASCLYSGSDITSGCAFDPEDGDFDVCSNNCMLNLDMGGSDSGKYSYESNGDDQPSGFTRKVYVIPDGTNGLHVRVSVTWNSSTFASSGNTPGVHLETWLYDHYDRYETF